MFLRFLAASFLILQAHPSFAGKLNLLEARQTSGFTRMEDAFENLCTLDASGLLSGTLRHGIREAGGWSEEVKISERLSSAELDSVLTLLSESAPGPFQEKPGACDTGDFIIRGKHRGTAFAIIEIHDCGPSVQNTSPAARKLENWIFTRCHWVK